MQMGYGGGATSTMMVPSGNNVGRPATVEGAPLGGDGGLSLASMLEGAKASPLSAVSLCTDMISAAATAAPMGSHAAPFTLAASSSKGLLFADSGVPSAASLTMDVRRDMLMEVLQQQPQQQQGDSKHQQKEEEVRMHQNTGFSAASAWGPPGGTDFPSLLELPHLVLHDDPPPLPCGESDSRGTVSAAFSLDALNFEMEALAKDLQVCVCGGMGSRCMGRSRGTG